MEQKVTKEKQRYESTNKTVRKNTKENVYMGRNSRRKIYTKKKKTLTQTRNT